jgi:anti-sigma factor RsiW
VSDIPRGEDEHRRRYRLVGDHGPGVAHVADLAAPYALGALDGTEREVVERHVPLCPACARLIAREQGTVSFLAYATVASSPDPDVKLSLLARIAHVDSESRPAASPRATGYQPRHVGPALTIPASRSVASSSALDGNLGHGSRWRLPQSGAWTGWPTVFLTVPLLVALLATGTWAVQLKAEANEREARANSFGATLEEALTAGNAHFELAPSQGAPEAKGWIVTNATEREATFFMKNAESRAGQVYELLGYGDGEAVSLATVKLDERGRGTTAFPLTHPLTNYRFLRVKASPADSGRTDSSAGGNALWLRLTTPTAIPTAGVPTRVP